MTDDPSFYQLTERYPDEAAAVAYFEAQRWPSGPVCTRCQSPDVYNARAVRRMTLWKCRKCSRQFTVTSGTVMEATKLPLRKWLFAFHMIGAGKKGISSRQLGRMIGVTLRSAWHLSHRIRATMTDNSQHFTGTVETDETYIGGKRKFHGRGYRGNKVAVQTIVERRCGPDGKYIGRAQTIALSPDDAVDGRTVGAKLRTHTDPEKTSLMTDQSPIYDKTGESFRSHDTVNHAKGEYARIDPLSGRLVSTNTAEGLFANLKRQIHGTHHSTSKKHLPRYLEEYDFKYNTRGTSDTARTEAAIRNMVGKRVTLFETAYGGTDALIGHKATEKGAQGTRRGKGKRAAPPGCGGTSLAKWSDAVCGRGTLAASETPSERAKVRREHIEKIVREAREEGGKRERAYADAIEAAVAEGDDKEVDRLVRELEKRLEDAAARAAKRVRRGR